ncbi:MAG: hypothetical protein VYC04_00215 [Actinomycetota bacterium]|nr:hypothetical protein [Actinomycetota bacterium]
METIHVEKASLARLGSSPLVSRFLNVEFFDHRANSAFVDAVPSRFASSEVNLAGRPVLEEIGVQFFARHDNAIKIGFGQFDIASATLRLRSDVLQLLIEVPLSPAWFVASACAVLFGAA